MNHLDLFSGIGGFALAAQTVWGEDYRCVGFCEIDSFCQATLRKNFKGVTIYGDIRGLTAERLAADTAGGKSGEQTEWGRQDSSRGGWKVERSTQAVGTICGGQDSNSAGSVGDARPLRIDLLTGGFPCQPFSTAGKRKGTEDDRFLWPEMFRVIREVKPRWIIGENVAGIIEMALGQVCSDLEELHYEVQCFVIPACAVNAPHRRDRVWIVAHRIGAGSRSDRRETGDEGRGTSEDRGTCIRQGHRPLGASGADAAVADASSDTLGEHGEWAESVGDRCRQSEMPTGDGDCPSSDTDPWRQEKQEQQTAGSQQCCGEPSPDTTDLLCDGSIRDERERERSEAVSQSGDGGGKEPSSDTTGDRRFWGGETAEVEEGLPPRPESVRQLEGRLEGCDCPSSDTSGAGLEGVADARDAGGSRAASEQRLGKFPDWSRDWREVAFESCLYRVDDGLPKRVARLPDGSTISESRWRQNSLKAYGNAIVPQVAMEIMRGIREVDHER